MAMRAKQLGIRHSSNPSNCADSGCFRGARPVLPTSRTNQWGRLLNSQKDVTRPWARAESWVETAGGGTSPHVGTVPLSASRVPDSVGVIAKWDKPQAELQVETYLPSVCPVRTDPTPRPTPRPSSSGLFCHSLFHCDLTLGVIHHSILPYPTRLAV
ncbi:hypothetical protein LZ32DRAFT_163557 [Colletotrichum eremochloae]|nr:hypothetical protein LZ32DRAFT_163557 [Colletotrichum eremochloae]